MEKWQQEIMKKMTQWLIVAENRNGKNKLYETNKVKQDKKFHGTNPIGIIFNEFNGEEHKVNQAEWKDLIMNALNEMLQTMTLINERNNLLQKRIKILEDVVLFKNDRCEHNIFLDACKLCTSDDAYEPRN